MVKCEVDWKMKKSKIILMFVVVIIMLNGCKSDMQTRLFNTEEGALDNKEYIYNDTIEEAIEKANSSTFKENPYMSRINKIIKIFEDDEKAICFYISEEEAEKEAIVICKLNLKNENNKKMYTVTRIIPLDVKKGQIPERSLEDVIRTMLDLSDYQQDLSINKGRFIYGFSFTDRIYSLKVENQEPNEIIEMDIMGSKYYFWYYENLKSEKSGSELEFTMDEEDSKKDKKEEEVKPKIVLP